MANSVFGTQVGRIIAERVAVGEHPEQRQEYAGHVRPGIAEWPDGEGRPTEREPGRGDQRMGVEHPHEHRVEEEAFDARLAGRELPVFEVGADDAHAVGAIPAHGGRLTNELQPGGDLPGVGESAALRSPRSNCHLTNAAAAWRNGR
jgi:hypothetical protein